VVRPSINKDNFITLSVKPEISNKVGDFDFVFNGADVKSPIIDKRTLDSNVLIKSGDTLAIGGLLSDQVSKARTKVPLLGDIPLLGYAFQSHDNERHKRNLLIFGHRRSSINVTVLAWKIRSRACIMLARSTPIRTAGEITPKARCA